MRHDICYGEARMRHADCPQTVLRKALNQCDTDLINDLLKLGFSGHDISFKLHKVRLIHYFLMRRFGRDYRAAHFLSACGVDTEIYKDIPLATMCKNSIDFRNN